SNRRGISGSGRALHRAHVYQDPNVKELSDKKCAPCEGGVKPLKPANVKLLSRQLHKDSKSIQRSLKFKDFYRTMSFVNALAHIANTEDHHPDLKVGYDHCDVTFST